MGNRSAFLLVLVLAGSLVLKAQKSAGTGCAACHDQGEKVAKSAHSPVACATCHVKHEEFPHPENLPKPACAMCHEQQAGDYSHSAHAQAAKRGNGAAPDCGVCHGAAHEVVSTKTADFHKGVPDTCGMCHNEIAGQYRTSVHGKAVARGVEDAPVCTDCHGEHSILAPRNEQSTVSGRNVRGTCARCHADVRLARRFGLPPDRITSFDSSFHGLAAKSGSETVANCSSCHGVHNILPSTDPKSMINARNLPQTCGKCHPGAGSRFALGKVHWGEGQGEPKAVEWVRLMYALVIPVTVGFMILHHGGDFVRKLYRLRLKPVPAGAPAVSLRNPEIRMLAFERIQHALLLVSFFVLAWSGFALKYPDQWWARPLVLFETRYPMRGVVHRTAAVIMVVVGLIHVASLAMDKRLREHWLSLIPVLRDAREAVGVLLYNLGVIRAKPQVSSHSYVAKLEYWAVVWGTAVMGLTGFMLWANNWTLRLIPKEWLDAATAVHFYEAVLASLAILVWHFYTVIFDPDVYPLDTAFLTGKSPRQPEPRHHAHPHQPAEPSQRTPGGVPPEAEGD